MPEIDPYAPTELLPRPRTEEPAPAAAPVFVDATGRRRRVAHRVVAAVSVAAGGYVLTVIWSLFGGPVAPDTLIPFSAPHSAASTAASLAATARPSATAHAPAPAASSAPAAAHSTNAASAVATAPTRVPSTAPSGAGSTTAGRRPTSAPGKPTATANGHGH